MPARPSPPYALPAVSAADLFQKSSNTALLEGIFEKFQGRLVSGGA
jgi:hypothetical protein